MNSLDFNLMKYECNVENKLQNDCNNYFAPNFENQFWYSSRFLPLNNFKYADNYLNNNSEQLIETAIHKMRSDSNQSNIRHESRDKTKESLKRSHYYCSNSCDDWGRRKRSRNSDSNSGNCYKRRYFDEPLYECECCDSLIYSSFDFKTHLKGKRHALNMKSMERKELSTSKTFRHSLERDLEETNEPIVGLDFINEVENDKYSNESIFECKLCHCYHMKTASVLQHILGFKHRLNFCKFVDLREAKSLMDIENRHKDSEIVRSFAERLERLYGRGNCKFINNDYKQRPYNRRDSRRSVEKSFNEQKHVINNESHKRSVPKKESKSESKDENVETDKKLIETIKTIRELCDKTLKFYSNKYNLSPNSIETNNKSNELSEKVVGLEDTNALIPKLDSTSDNSGVIPSQLDSNGLSNIKTEIPIVSNSSELLVQ